MCQYFLLNHLPNTPFTAGKPYQPFRWISPEEPLMLRFWALNWLAQKGGTAGQNGTWAAFVLFSAVFGFNKVRHKRHKRPVSVSYSNCSKHLSTECDSHLHTPDAKLVSDDSSEIESDMRLRCPTNNGDTVTVPVYHDLSTKNKKSNRHLTG